jgi:hypothetical protein
VLRTSTTVLQFRIMHKAVHFQHRSFRCTHICILDGRELKIEKKRGCKLYDIHAMFIAPLCHAHTHTHTHTGADNTNPSVCTKKSISDYILQVNIVP